MFPQGTQLIAKVPFQMKPEGQSRSIVVKVGDKFIVTSPCYMQANGVKVDRVGKAKLNIGYMLSAEQIEQLFTGMD